LVRSLIKRSNREGTSKGEGNVIHFRKAGAVLFLLIVYALLLEKIGYLITAFLILVFLFRSAGSTGWRFVLIISAVTTLVTYAFFTYFGLRFPAGFLGIGGFLR
jgi:hypothetical protein